MRKTLFIFTVLLTQGIYSQSFYDEGTIQTISITFSQSNWDALLDAEKAGNENYIMAQSIDINGTVYDSVGVKYKGNSTYNANQTKNPFHIELDTYKDHEHDGYTDIKLSNVAKDPSFIREVLSYKILRNYMDAPLSNYANVYVNGSLMGLYVSSESISKKFVKKYFGSKSNTFVKCNPPDGAGQGTTDLPNLTYAGTDSTNDSYDEAYEIKSDYGWTELIYLCDTLNNHIADIENILDVDRALWMLAFNNVLVNLDSYSGGFAQNYYLYKDDFGRFLPVVWDLNESFGTFSSTGSGNLTGTTSKQQMDYLLHDNDANYPLISKLLSIPTYKKMYLAHCKTFLEDNFSPTNSYYNDGLSMQSIISSSVSADGNKFFTYNNFLDNLTTNVTSGGGPGGSSTLGITNLMDARYTYLMAQTDFSATQPSISSINSSNSAPVVGDVITITATINNEVTAYLRYRTEARAPFEKIQMYDDGLHNDGAANDNVFGADANVNSALFEYYIYAENNTIGKFSPTNAEHEFYTVAVSTASLGGDIVINEFMASNSITETDDEGDYDDWIEIYNKGSIAIDISNYGLSDDIDNLNQFTFPSGTILNSNSYIIVWADKDSSTMGYHADFKLSSNGESIYLTDTSSLIVDSVNFGPQNSDISYGRYPNGTGDFMTMTSTFSATNDTTSTPSVFYDIVINELMASNSSTQMDQDGEYDDWIELYNNETFTVDLGGYRLTDDSSNYNQFTFPIGTTINANSYIIVWADNDGSQTGYHTDFKLSSTGESVYLTNSTLDIIDEVHYPTQYSDTSYGRFPNGTGNFQLMISPTYNAENNNLTTRIIQNSIPDMNMVLYPNPTSNVIYIKFIGDMPSDLSIYSNVGQILYQNTPSQSMSINVEQYDKGLYFIKSGNYLYKFIIE